MKKLLCLLLIMGFILCSFPSHALSVVSSGSVSQANMRLSIVNGTAFVDFTSAGALTAYIGHKLVITDSTSKTLSGYIRAVGTGETYGDELLTNGNMETGDPPSGWTAYNATLDGVADERTGGTGAQSLNILRTGSVGQAYQSITTSNGGLFILTGWEKNSTNFGNIRFMDSLDNLLVSVNANNANWGQWTSLYGTATTATSKIALVGLYDNAQSIRCDDVSFKQVLTPSTTGVTITVTPNGSVYNWESETSGFNRNGSSGYTYAIYRRSKANIMYFD